MNIVHAGELTNAGPFRALMLIKVHLQAGSI